MKAVLLLIAIFFSSHTIGQVGKLDIRLALINADTSYPYFLNTWLKNKDSTVLKIALTSSGLYHFRNLKQGIYHLELNDYKSRAVTIDSIQIFADSVTTILISYPGLCKFIYPNDYKPLCPKGHSDDIVKIVYGFPTNKTMKKANKGLIHLGGCIVTDCNPRYYCNKHKIEL